MIPRTVYDDRHGAGMRVAVAARKLRAADKEGGRERVGRGRIARHHAGGKDAAGRPSRARVEHVAIALPVRDDELLAGAAGADGAVANPQASRYPAGEPRTDVDRPAAPAPADGQHAAAAGGEQRTLGPARAQHAAHAIERVALPDRAEADLDALAREGDGLPVRVEDDVPHADALEGPGDLGVVRDAPLALQESPAPAQRRRGDV